MDGGEGWLSKRNTGMDVHVSRHCEAERMGKDGLDWVGNADGASSTNEEGLGAGHSPNRANPRLIDFSFWI